MIVPQLSIPFFALVFSHINNPLQELFPYHSCFANCFWGPAILHRDNFCSAVYFAACYLQENLTPYLAVSYVLVIYLNLKQGLVICLLTLTGKLNWILITEYPYKEY